MTDRSTSGAPSFFTGFMLGGILAVGASYLYMTKSGRKLSLSLLKYAEDFGERGEDHIEEKLSTIVEKLKSGSKALKKSVDSKL